MPTLSATAAAHPNIAFIKYWGNIDNALNLPANGSISMNLGGLLTTTTVHFDPGLLHDTLEINQQPHIGEGLLRVQNFMQHIRELSHSELKARIISSSNFPLSAGLASSAAAYAALALASTSALEISLPEKDLSALARLGSGSAARSIPGGYVEWYASSNHRDSFAESIANSDYWALMDVIAIVQKEPKQTGSSNGHMLADTSPLQSARVESAPSRLLECREAILDRNFSRLSDVIELDSMMMHAVMMTSTPPLYYWEPATLQIIKSAFDWRKDGVQVCVTVDAGANPHLICSADDALFVKEKLLEIPAVQTILISSPGGPAHLV